MWLSPSDETGEGRRYSLREISALIYPVDMLLDWLERSGPKDALDEPMLRRMETEEIVYALYEVFQALLEETPVPDSGHPGYQEALIAELMGQMFGRIQAEFDLGEGSSAREAAWDSLRCLEGDGAEEGPRWIAWLEARGISLDDPFPYLSEKLTPEDWQDMLQDLLEGEFLQDFDWRLEQMLDLPEERTEEVRGMMGLDLDRAQRLPHTPTRAELTMATFYLKYLVWKHEVDCPSHEDTDSEE